jgi:monofunctional biosynthetic peptidoglycan transglycosylase
MDRRVSDRLDGRGGETGPPVERAFGTPDPTDDRHEEDGHDASAMPATGHRSAGPSMIRRGLYAALLVLVSLAALPAVLVPVYAIPGVRPVSTLMLAEHFSFQPYDREWTPIGEIAPVLVSSVMMSEDGQYCFHGGVDWNALGTVVDQAVNEGEAGRGASTIPMQTAKNLFLWNGRSFLRKGLELPLALYGDFVWSKRRTMEIYLNIAEWGDGIYGIGAASRFYFNRSPAQLTPRQAALLAVTLPSPRTRDPARPSAGLRRLAQVVEARARASGDYTGCVLGTR